MPADNTPSRGAAGRKPKATAAIDPTYAHLQPQATDFERVVLGALMIDKDAFSMVSELLRPETFYDSKHQKIYQAIQTLSYHDSPVDIMTVTNEMEREGTLEEVGGSLYLVDLTANVVSSANIVYHSQVLCQKFLARQLISFASQVETKAFDPMVDVNVLMQEAEGNLFELSQRNMAQEYTQIDPVLRQAQEMLQKASANTSGLTGITTGYTKLDDITSGWQRSDLVVIAGRPAMGKTAFALSLAKNIAVDNNTPVAFFSLEMSNVQLVNRLISNVCEIEGHKIMNGQLDSADWERLDKNLRKLEGKPIYVDDTPGMSIFEMRTKARRLRREKNVELIIIDYLQLMNASGSRFSNRQEEVSTISRSLKGLAKELDIPVIALSQLNRTVENREGYEGKRPQLSDLRESGAIEQDADMVIFVHRPEYYHIYQDDKGNDMHGKAEIIIAKHRKGKTDTVLLNFEGKYTRFQNPEDSALNALPMDGGGEYMGSRMNMDGDDPFGGAAGAPGF